MVDYDAFSRRHIGPSEDQAQTMLMELGYSSMADFIADVVPQNIYGKLVKQIVPSSLSDGWDGTFNNIPLPSTDYWFTLDYTENRAQKQFKAHFSLKR